MRLRFARFLPLASVFCVAVGLVIPATAQPRLARPAKVVVLGDSLSAGYLIPAQEAFPAVLQASLRAQGRSVSIVDASIVNDTSWDGLARLDRYVPADADGVILELGANDMVRWVGPATTRASLEKIIQRLQARGIPVLLAGFRMPISWGHDAAGFEEMYRSLARQYRLVYYPDFSAGLWTQREYRLFDGVHPSPEGVRLIVAGIQPTVTRFLATLDRRRPAALHTRPETARKAKPVAAVGSLDEPPSIVWP